MFLILIISPVFLKMCNQCASHICRETENENKQCSKTKPWISKTLDKALNGTVIDQALPSLHGGSLVTTLTVPLM